MSQASKPGTIRWRLHLASPPRRVYQAIATDAGRATFWAESTHEADGFITFDFLGHPSHTARILHAEPPSRFAIEYFGAPTTFNIVADGSGGTDLQLKATGVEAAALQETLAGWVSVLMAMKAALDFGVDLRNHDPSHTWQQGYADN